MEYGSEWDAESVAALRARLEMTQAEFSETLGVRQQTVSEWETRMHAPKGASKKLLSMVREQAGSYKTSNSRETGQAGESGVK
ncbi:MAG: helix-turn-helix domain-containing protein [Chloroflexi bacterium]|nr:helix-turn-helix domain-containing protein [Chloroflexota bacterium]